MDSPHESEGSEMATNQNQATRCEETGKAEPIDVKHCAGCRDDFYNDHNPLGVKMCWSRTTAKLIPLVLVHVDLPPPYKHLKAKDRPNCYRAERHVSVSPDRIGSDGYWNRS